MKKLCFLIASVTSLVFANDLRSIPCQYLMSGEVLESGIGDDFRYCVINSSDKNGDSYLIHLIVIGYSTNMVTSAVWLVMPLCEVSEITLFNQGRQTMYMVDTLAESSWVKRLYRRTCH